MKDQERPLRAYVGPHRYANTYLVSQREQKVGRALRFAMSPLNEESLSGFIARTTSFHVLLYINGVLRRAGINMSAAGPLAFLPMSQLERLTDIIGCTVEEIAARRYTRIHPEHVVSDLRIGDVTIRAFDLETTERRIAPGTLQIHPFHRTAWMMRLLPYCEMSYELLRSDCSECARPLRWKNSCGIGVCESCEAKVRPSVEPPLFEGDRENYAVFADLLSTDPKRRGKALSNLNPLLRSLDQNTLVEMVLGIGDRLVAAERLQDEKFNRKAIHRLPPDYLGSVIARGIGMMRNWPDDFRTWARERAETLRNDRHAFLAHRAALRRLGARSRVSPAQAAVMREALGDLFAKEQRCFAAPQTMALKYEASAMLGITNETIAELAGLGHLTEEKILGRSRDHVRYPIAELVEIRRAQTESRTWPEIARSIGISLYGIEQLCCMGMLDREMNAAVQHLRGAWGITTASLNTFWNDIERKATQGLPPAGSTPLGTAVRRIGGRLKPWGAIFDTLSGLDQPACPMNFWISDEASTPWARRIHVFSTDIARFDGVAFDPDAHAPLRFSETTNITGAREVLNLGGIPHCDLRTLFANDIASRPQFGPEKSISLSAVLREAQRSISVAEICERNGWSPRRLRRQVLKFADARTETGWKRDVIEGSGLLKS
jgi:hypothetical protein